MLWKIRHEKKVESWHQSKERKPKRAFRAVAHVIYFEVIDYENWLFLKIFFIFNINILKNIKKLIKKILSKRQKPTFP